MSTKLLPTRPLTDCGYVESLLTVEFTFRFGGKEGETLANRGRKWLRTIGVLAWIENDLSWLRLYNRKSEIAISR